MIVYWEDLMEELEREFKIPIVVKTKNEIETYFISLKNEERRD